MQIFASRILFSDFAGRLRQVILIASELSQICTRPCFAFRSPRSRTASAMPLASLLPGLALGPHGFLPAVTESARRVKGIGDGAQP